MKCLQKDPQRRYATAALLAADLQRFVDGKPIAARPVNAIGRTFKWARRRPAQAVSLLATLVLLSGLAGGSLWFISQRSARTRTVDAELQHVVTLEKQGRWDEARTVLIRAQVELGNHGPRSLNSRLEECNRDLDLVARLDAIQFHSMAMLPNVRNTQVESEYRAAFNQVGIAALEADKHSAATVIRNSPIRLALVTTLDQWLIETTDLDRRNWLLEVSQSSDEDQSAWKRAARDPKTWNDKAAFDGVVKAAPISQASISLLYALAWHGTLFGEDRIPLLTKVQEVFPTELRANLLLGSAYAEKGDGSQAMRYLQAAVACQPPQAIAEGSLGSVLYMAGRKEESVVHFRNAICLKPSYATLYLALADSLSDLGRYDQAICELELAAKYAPYEAQPYLRMGRCFDRMDKPESAVKAYLHALLLDPMQSIPSYKTRPEMKGILLWEKRWPDWQTLMNSGPHSVTFWLEYLSLSLFLGHEEDYRRTRTRLLATSGDTRDPNIANYIGRVCLLLPASKEETQEAVALINRALSDKSMLDPRAAVYFQVSKGLADLRQGHPQDALNILRGAPRTELQPMPQLIIAMAQQQLGQTQDARRTLAAALDMFDWNRNRAIDSNAWAFHVLRRQAEKMIQGTPSTSDARNAPAFAPLSAAPIAHEVPHLSCR